MSPPSKPDHRTCDGVFASPGNCTCECGAGPEVRRLRAENERLRDGIVAIYRENPPLAAKVCDEVIDRSGRLLGEVRILALASTTKEATG